MAIEKTTMVARPWFAAKRYRVWACRKPRASGVERGRRDQDHSSVQTQQPPHSPGLSLVRGRATVRRAPSSAGLSCRHLAAGWCGASLRLALIRLSDHLIRCSMTRRLPPLGMVSWLARLQLRKSRLQGLIEGLLGSWVAVSDWLFVAGSPPEISPHSRNDAQQRQSGQ